jgi:hypothetical protein
VGVRGREREMMGTKKERGIETGSNVIQDMWCVVWQLRISRPDI